MQFSADSRPWLKFEGEKVLSRSREEIWCLSRLQLAVHTGAVNDDAESMEYDLRLTCANEDLGCIPVESGSVAIEKYCQSLPSGIHRVVAELCPRGTRRAVSRSACLLWKGLIGRDIAGRMLCDGGPANILTTRCVNASFDERARRIGPLDSTRDTFQLEFQGPTTQGNTSRTFTLEWAVPGVFLKLQDYAAQPVLQSDLKLGLILPASPLSRELLQIRSTQDGYLSLDGRKIRAIAAEKVASLHIASLAEGLESGAGTLQLSHLQRALRSYSRWLRTLRNCGPLHKPETASP